MSLVLASLTDWVRDAVGSGGYAGLSGLILLENVFPPIPSEVILPLAGYYVSLGDFNYFLAVIAATLGSVAGALIIYWVARAGGRPLLLRFGWLLRVDEKQLDRIDERFESVGPWLVLGGRLIPGVRSLVSIPAGLSRMPMASFIGLTTLGSALWNAALIGAGWALGSNYERVAEVIGPISTVLVGVLIVALLALAAWWFLRTKPLDSELDDVGN